MVTVVSGCDHGDDACRCDIVDRVDQRVVRGIRLRPASREVDDVHAVSDGSLEGRDQLGRERLHAGGRRDGEDAVVPEPRTRCDAAQPACRRVIAAARGAGAGVAGSDSRDVRSVERDRRIDGELSRAAGARPRERTRDDHLWRRVARVAEREAARVRERRCIEVRVPRIDAVVDDADLDALAARARRGMELVRADDARASIRRERVRKVRVDLRRKRQPCERRQLRDGQLDGHAVEHDLVPLLHARLRNRAKQAGCVAALRLDEPRDIAASCGARRVESLLRLDGRERAPVGRRERRERQSDDDADRAGAMGRGDADRPGANAWQDRLAESPPHRLKRCPSRNRRRQRRGDSHQTYRTAQGTRM